MKTVDSIIVDNPAEVAGILAKSHLGTRVEGEERQKMLGSLKDRTKTRASKHGKEDILLHRGMDDDEHSKFVRDGHCHHCEDKDNLYEWSTDKKDADDYKGKRHAAKEKGHSVSAWIHEDGIHSLSKKEVKKSMAPQTPAAPNTAANNVPAPNSIGFSSSGYGAMASPTTPSEVN